MNTKNTCICFIIEPVEILPLVYYSDCSFLPPWRQEAKALIVGIGRPIGITVCTDDERQAIDDKAAAAQERDKEMEEQILQSAARAAALQQQGGDYPFPLTESERLIQSQQREQALREELEAALAQLREQSAAQVTGSPAPATDPEPQRAVSAPEEDDPALVVRRVRQSSDYFHTVSDLPRSRRPRAWRR